MNQSQTNTPSSPPIKKFIHSTLQSPPVLPGVLPHDHCIYTTTRAWEAAGAWDGTMETTSLFSSFFSSSFLSELLLRGPHRFLSITLFIDWATFVPSLLFHTILFIYNSVQLLLFVILLSCYGIIEIFCVIPVRKRERIIEVLDYWDLLINNRAESAHSW